MRNTFLRTGAICLALFGGTAAIIKADTTTYLFTGNCDVPPPESGMTNCTGTVNATLVLQNYTPGTGLDLSNFVSFKYQSNVFSIDSTIADLFSGDITAFLPGTAVVSLENELGVGPYRFFTAADGTWEAVLSSDDFGSDGVWTVGQSAAVPEPAQGIPLLLLTAVGFWRLRRRSRHAGAAS